MPKIKHRRLLTSRQEAEALFWRALHAERRQAIDDLHQEPLRRFAKLLEAAPHDARDGSFDRPLGWLCQWKAIARQSKRDADLARKDSAQVMRELMRHAGGAPVVSEQEVLQSILTREAVFCAQFQALRNLLHSLRAWQRRWRLWPHWCLVRSLHELRTEVLHPPETEFGREYAAFFFSGQTEKVRKKVEHSQTVRRLGRETPPEADEVTAQGFAIVGAEDRLWPVDEWTLNETKREEVLKQAVPEEFKWLVWRVVPERPGGEVMSEEQIADTMTDDVYRPGVERIKKAHIGKLEVVHKVKVPEVSAKVGVLADLLRFRIEGVKRGRKQKYPRDCLGRPIKPRRSS